MEGRKLPRMPWVWTRRVVAERWHIPPPLVDEFPWSDIQEELELAALEAEFR